MPWTVQEPPLFAFLPRPEEQGPQSSVPGALLVEHSSAQPRRVQSTSSISSWLGASEKQLSRLPLVAGSIPWAGDSSGSGAGPGRCCLDDDTSSNAGCTGGFDTAAAIADSGISESGTFRHISPSNSSHGQLQDVTVESDAVFLEQVFRLGRDAITPSPRVPAVVDSDDCALTLLCRVILGNAVPAQPEKHNQAQVSVCFGVVRAGQQTSTIFYFAGVATAVVWCVALYIICCCWTRSVNRWTSVSSQQQPLTA